MKVSKQTTATRNSEKIEYFALSSRNCARTKFRLNQVGGKKMVQRRIHIFRDKTFSANGPIVQLPSLELSEGLLIDLFTRLVILVRLAVPGMSESTS
jgi:hypothetical protein